MQIHSSFTQNLNNVSTFGEMSTNWFLPYAQCTLIVLKGTNDQNVNRFWTFTFRTT